MKELNKLNLHYKNYMIDLFFSEVIETDDKNYTFEIKEVFKKDGEIVNNHRVETYQLITYSDLEKDIFEKILSVDIKRLKYPKNIFQSIFKKNELRSVKFNEQDIIFSNKEILSAITHSNKVEIKDTNYLIILSGRDKLLINKKDKLFYFDKDRFKVYEII